MSVKAITFDAYGTLLQNENLLLIPQRIVADHGLSVSVDDIWQVWMNLYLEATQLTPFCTLRDMQRHVLPRVLRHFDVRADAIPYVELFFEVTTKVVLYPEVLHVLYALNGMPCAIVSNADREHLAAWHFTLPVAFILISETVRAYKPHPLMFQAAVEKFALQPHEVLHVGDSEVDDVQGAKAAGLQVAWINRNGRARRADVPQPDFEIADLTELLGLL